MTLCKEAVTAITLPGGGKWIAVKNALIASGVEEGSGSSVTPSGCVADDGSRALQSV